VAVGKFSSPVPNTLRPVDEVRGDGRIDGVCCPIYNKFISRIVYLKEKILNIVGIAYISVLIIYIYILTLIYKFCGNTDADLFTSSVRLLKIPSLVVADQN